MMIKDIAYRYDFRVLQERENYATEPSQRQDNPFFNSLIPTLDAPLFSVEEIAEQTVT
jgi:hypothetical protein